VPGMQPGSELAEKRKGKRAIARKKILGRIPRPP